MLEVSIPLLRWFFRIELNLRYMYHVCTIVRQDWTLNSEVNICVFVWCPFGFVFVGMLKRLLFLLRRYSYGY
jgi:hypothetical protein